MSPTSPGFRPITSPQSPHVPRRTTPTSPVECSAPPISALPCLPEYKAPPPQSSLPNLPAGQVYTGTEFSSVIESKLSSGDVSEQEPVTALDAPSAPLPENPVPSKGKC